MRRYILSRPIKLWIKVLLFYSLSSCLPVHNTCRLEDGLFAGSIRISWMYHIILCLDRNIIRTKNIYQWRICFYEKETCWAIWNAIFYSNQGERRIILCACRINTIFLCIGNMSSICIGVFKWNSVFLIWHKRKYLKAETYILRPATIIMWYSVAWELLYSSQTLKPT